MAKQATGATWRSRWHGKCIPVEEYFALPEEKPYLEARGKRARGRIAAGNVLPCKGP